MVRQALRARDVGPWAAAGGLVLRVDGTRPPSAEQAEAVAAVCDAIEDGDATSPVIIDVSGAPAGAWATQVTLSAVRKWELALRRLERVPALTIGLASGDCGGIAIDALLATDYRMASDSVRLVVPVVAGATWPGMALFRLVRQGGNAGAVRRAALLGVPLTAHEALTSHLIHEIVDDIPRALAMITELASGLSGQELAVRRQLITEAVTVGFEEAIGAHLAACDRALRRVTAQALS